MSGGISRQASLAKSNRAKSNRAGSNRAKSNGAACGRGRAGRSRGARGGGQSAAASVLTDPDAGVNRPRGDRPESGGGNAQPGDPEPRSSRRRRGLPDALGLANTHSNGLGNSDSAAPGQKMRSSRNGSTRPRRSGQSQVAAIRRRGSGLVRVEQAAGRRRRPRGDGFRGRSTGSGFGQGSVRESIERSAEAFRTAPAVAPELSQPG